MIVRLVFPDMGWQAALAAMTTVTIAALPVAANAEPNIRPGLAEPNIRPGLAEPNIRPGLAEPNIRPGLVEPNIRPGLTVGGDRLATRGTIWNRATGVGAPPSIGADSWIIADGTTGQVLAAKDPHGHYRPASTLKLLTALTLIPRLNPRAPVRPNSSAQDAEGSAVGLSTNWTYRVQQLFYGLLMDSGNDCAVALSDANGGLHPTIAEMNAAAAKIQAGDTIAATPDGLDDDPHLSLAQQRSSSYDLALILRADLELPAFRTYVGTVSYPWPAPPTKAQRAHGRKVGGWPIITHDHLLLPGERYPGMIGGKNGYTVASDGTYAGAAQRGGHMIIIALLRDQPDFWNDARSLLNWGFRADGKVTPVGALVSPPAPTPSPSPSRTGTDRHRAATATAVTGGNMPWGLLGALVALVVALAAGATLWTLHRRRNNPGQDALP
jgi:D-alanyl-D-alanine carboxypeptidase (penicillin-binding protein 5/6)